MFWWLLVIGLAAAALWLASTTWDHVVFSYAQWELNFTLRDLFMFPPSLPMLCL